MRFRKLLASLAAAPLMLGAALLAVPAASAEASCADTKLFEVGGHWDPHAQSYDGANAKLPDGFEATKIHYPAEIWPMPKQPGSTERATHTLDESVAIGMKKLSGAVQNFHNTCPGSHMLISGYSEGALVAGNVLGELSEGTAIPHKQIDGVLYSDGRRPSSGGQGGIETNLPTFMDGLTMEGPRGFGDLAVHEICNQNDGICNSPNPFTNLVAFANSAAGYFMGDHGYNVDPVGDRGSGDTVNPQTPRIQYGPAIPVPAPTPYELFNGKLPSKEAKQVVQAISDLVYGMLPPAAQKKYAQLPALSGGRSGSQDQKTVKAMRDLVGSQPTTKARQKLPHVADRPGATNKQDAVDALERLVNQLPEKQANKKLDQLPNPSQGS